MEWITNNWFLIVVGLCGVAVGSMAIKKFLNLPTKEQIKNIKEWLLYAVIEAEKELGSGTGAVKLRYVYDMAVAKFKWLSFISFEMFSGWVDEALDIMKEQLQSNKAIATYVEGE